MSMSNAHMDCGPRGSAHSFSEEAGQLIERQIRRKIQYRWILRQNIIRLFTQDNRPFEAERCASGAAGSRSEA
jgi:hypothetical protein